MLRTRPVFASLTTRRLTLLLAGILLVSLAGCGQKGPLKPPEKQVTKQPE